MGIDKLELIIEKYPNLNIEWLLTGKGEMLKPDIEKSEINVDYKEKYYTLLEENRELSNENRNLHKQLEFIKKGELQEKKETKQPFPAI
jgi:hypothetical protein